MFGNERGFSLLEVLVTSAVLVFILTGVSALYLGGEGIVATGDLKSELQQQGRLALTRMIQEIKKAREGECSGQKDQVILIYEENGITKRVRFRVNGQNQLIREVDNNLKGVYSGQNPLASYVEGVSFTREDNIIRVDLKLARGEISFTIRGGASLRNPV